MATVRGVAVRLMFVVTALSCQLSVYAAVSSTDVLNCPSKPDALPELIYIGIPKSGETECVDGTDGSKCDIFLRMAPNEEDDMFVDFYLEGSLKGWVAVGFSLDQTMGLTDVVGCIQSSNGSLGAINTWNPAHYNERDPTQDQMCSYDIQYSNSRLKCHFSRYRGIINAGYDYNINDSYYLILGHSETQGPISGAFTSHLPLTPKITRSKFNVFDYNADNSSNGTSGVPAWSNRLRKAHGIMMLIAWSVLASIGAYVSSWMKPALPGKRWFNLHRGLMIAALPVAIAALICVFVANAKNGIIIDFNECSLLTAHFSLGVIATVLMLINPLIALCRCNPKSPNRWIFNTIHGVIGSLSITVAHTAIGTGITYFDNECDISKKSLMVFLYVSWQIGFVLVFQIFLNIVFTAIALGTCKGKERFYLAPSLIKFCLKFPSENDEQTLLINGTEVEIDQVYSKDYKLRGVLFVIYTSVNCAVVLALVILAATK